MSGKDSPPLTGILKNDHNDHNETVASPSSYLGIARTQSPRSTPKSLSFASKDQVISPLMLGTNKDVDDLDLDGSSSGRKLKIRGPKSKRLAGRPSHQSSISSLQSIADDSTDGPDSEPQSGQTQSDHHLFSGGLVGQLTSWLREERSKQAARSARRKGRKPAPTEPSTNDTSTNGRASDVSEADVDLDRLEQILKESFPKNVFSRRGSTIGRFRPSVKRLHKASSSGNFAASSDTEYFDGDVVVPSAEACLDNSKTLGYGGGAPTVSSDDLSLTRQQTASEEAWGLFKFEIVRLTHTLRLKGWRRVPMEMSGEIEVSRLSGALTNAVYVVSPPANLPEPSTSADHRPTPKRQPPKLLLRIYGPQVEHLIDREAELQILRRLARKRIGPRLLGTFSNGRFEEYFNASPLTPIELRTPDVSRQIAKRMRELHDGIDLLEQERDDGPFVWRNWDKWQDRVEQVASWLDAQIVDQHHRASNDAWKERGFVCGTEWSIFKQTLKNYREWLAKQAGGSKKLRQQLVFAHNDTQYGNILRVLPSGTSPLLLPANTHKQLIVIDFEYANANTPGLEFANHFTEWCYNYHDASAPWRCNTSTYPTAEEQNRFVQAYVQHRPGFPTPRIMPLDSTEPEPISRPNSGPGEKRPGPTQSISNFMLDARAPPSATPTTPTSSYFSLPSSSAVPGPDDLSDIEEAQIKALLKQTREWRMANTAQWVAWGIVQAKVPGMPLFGPDESAEIAEDGLEKTKKAAVEDAKMQSQPDEDGSEQNGNGGTPDAEDAEEAAEEEFDYLAYARDRAMFFWGDAVKLGFVKLEELPSDVQRDIKLVEC